MSPMWEYYYQRICRVGTYCYASYFTRRGDIMDKRDMERATKEADDLLGSLDPDMVKVLAQRQYDELLALVGAGTIKLSVCAYTGDEDQANIARKAIKQGLSSLDALCERFGITSKHGKMKNVLDNPGGQPKQEKDEKQKEG